jgi:release factor glutamine methyltransferase
MITIAELMTEMRASFRAANLDDPAAEARILLEGMTGYDRTALLTRGDDVVHPDIEVRLRSAVLRRLAGEPPFRILGKRSFYGLEFILSSATLEPRQDTEILVDAVLAQVKNRKDEALRILDLGTGTGAICQALLANLPKASGIGSDLSREALTTASINAHENGLTDRFQAIESHWFEKIEGQFDVIVSNPPYIASDVISTLDREVRDHDPILALDGGEDGLDAYRELARNALPYLCENSIVAVETGFDQRFSVTDIFSSSGYRVIAAVKDYGGNDRVLVFTAEKRP